jgi:hypothetical protein
MSTYDDIVDRFTYHPPTSTQIPKYERIRAEAKDFALLLFELCPDSVELKEAIIHIDIAVMRANAAVARHS